VHSHYSDLCTLPAELRRKMWLYHYNPGPLPDVRAQGFRGLVQRGQCFDFTRPETFDGTLDALGGRLARSLRLVAAGHEAGDHRPERPDPERGLHCRILLCR
jgi:hypothetical protein